MSVVHGVNVNTFMLNWDAVMRGRSRRVCCQKANLTVDPPLRLSDTPFLLTFTRDPRKIFFFPHPLCICLSGVWSALSPRFIRFSHLSYLCDIFDPPGLHFFYWLNLFRKSNLLDWTTLDFWVVIKKTHLSFLVGVEGKDVVHHCSVSRNTRDVWHLGLWVERNTEVNLLTTSETLEGPSSMRLWVMNS